MRHKKYRGYKRRLQPDGFMGDFMALQWIRYWGMIDTAKRQSFYDVPRKSRKAGKALSARTYNDVRNDYKKRGEWE